MAGRSRQFKGYTLNVVDDGVRAVAKTGEHVGYLIVRPNNVIEDVAVDAKHQEKGIASAMLKFGRQFRPIEHDLESNMTPSGHGWAQANP